MFSHESSPSTTHKRRRTTTPHDHQKHEQEQQQHATNDSGPRQGPNPGPVFQYLAFGVIILLGLLQLLPATHYRHPFDPLRNWVPLNSNETSSFFTERDVERGDDGFIHVVSWMDCLDLHVLSVLANSTLCSSSYPELVVFHFFIPKGKEDKVSYYKLKVLFPHSNLEIHGQDEVKGRIEAAFSGQQYAAPNFEEIVSFIIPSVHSFLSKFIFVSSNLIMKGKVEELIGFDLTKYAIAVAEDCSERLNDYVNLDVLNAIQRSASKPWISETPYSSDACLPDLSVVLIDANRIENDFLEAVSWWTKVLNLNQRPGVENPALALALYNRHRKLPSSWLVKASKTSEKPNSMVIRYDGPKTTCFEHGGHAVSQPAFGDAWKRTENNMFRACNFDRFRK